MKEQNDALLLSPSLFDCCGCCKVQACSPKEAVTSHCCLEDSWCTQSWPEHAGGWGREGAGNPSSLLLLLQKYVQDVLQEQLAQTVFKALKEQGGHIYVCGDVTMAGDVLKTIQRIVRQQGQLSVEEAGAFISKLRVSGICTTRQLLPRALHLVPPAEWAAPRRGHGCWEVGVGGDCSSHPCCLHPGKVGSMIFLRFGCAVEASLLCRSSAAGCSPLRPCWAPAMSCAEHRY